jgi:hypothetical protein
MVLDCHFLRNIIIDRQDQRIEEYTALQESISFIHLIFASNEVYTNLENLSAKKYPNL